MAVDPEYQQTNSPLWARACQLCHAITALYNEDESVSIRCGEAHRDMDRRHGWKPCQANELTRLTVVAQ